MVPYKERVLYLRVSSRIERIEEPKALSARMVKTPNQESRLPLILGPGCEYKSYASCHPRPLHHLGERGLDYADYVGYGGYAGYVGYARYAPWVRSERRLARYYLQIC